MNAKYEISIKGYKMLRGDRKGDIGVSDAWNILPKAVVEAKSINMFRASWTTI